MADIFDSWKVFFLFVHCEHLAHVLELVHRMELETTTTQQAVDDAVDCVCPTHSLAVGKPKQNEILFMWNSVVRCAFAEILYRTTDPKNSGAERMSEKEFVCEFIPK